MTTLQVATVSKRQMIVASSASVLGWSLDLFDLFILLYVAPEIGKLFFPADIPTLSLAAVYASFAVTLLMRPVGSAIFGSYADRKGRKKAMVIAVTGVGISTAMFGLLPTVQQVGVVAAVLFIILRLIQGVFVGGVVASTHTMGTESVPPQYRGLMSGLIGGAGAGLGSLLASIVYFLVSSAFPGEEFSEWGWRFMFYSGILSSLLGYFVYKSLEESPFFEQLKRSQSAQKGEEAQPAQSPVRVIFTQYLSVLLINLLIVIGGGSAYYLTSGYLPTFLKVINELPSATSSKILMLASLAAIVSAVLLGALSDVIGRKKVFLGTGVVCIVALPWSFSGLAEATSVTAIAFYACVLAFLGNAAYAPVLIFLNERFPTAVRSSGTGLSWNMGFAVGGVMPTFVSLAAGATANIPLTLGYFAIGVFILYLIGSVIIPETKGNFK